MTIKKIMNSIESTLDDMDMEYTSETSKYPSKVLFITTTDGDGKVGILAMGTTKTGSSSVFIQCNVSLRSLANKKDAMTMVYKVLGLE
jgi:flavin reductase (DIM6/NTAB) family NADH-FMN oxidoreductase RutF